MSGVVKQELKMEEQLVAFPWSCLTDISSFPLRNVSHPKMVELRWPLNVTFWMILVSQHENPKSMNHREIVRLISGGRGWWVFMFPVLNILWGTIREYDTTDTIRSMCVSVCVCPYVCARVCVWRACVRICSLWMILSSLSTTMLWMSWLFFVLICFFSEESWVIYI